MAHDMKGAIFGQLLGMMQELSSERFHSRTRLTRLPCHETKGRRLLQKSYQLFYTRTWQVYFDPLVDLMVPIPTSLAWGSRKSLAPRLGRIAPPGKSASSRPRRNVGVLSICCNSPLQSPLQRDHHCLDFVLKQGLGTFHLGTLR